MVHVIHHRFSNTVKIKAVKCNLCEKPMIFGVKCKECKYRCHRDCVDKVPPSCGLPNELADVFRRFIRNEGRQSPGPSNSGQSTMNDISNSAKKETLVDHVDHSYRGRYTNKPVINIPPFDGPDSSSNTSCTSSTPSSPAFLLSHTPTSASKIHSFNFPEVSSLAAPPSYPQMGQAESSLTKESRDQNTQNFSKEVVETQKSNDSDKTISGVSGSASTDSEKTLAGRIDSQDSQISDADQGDRTWPRQNSLTSREWDIPYDELKIEEEIGTGRFGTVFKGQWHGYVAVKRQHLTNLDDKQAIEAFQKEVATFRKTRHENLVLFMGACMKPPHLAIVTSFCKGQTLYTHIHERKEKFNLNRILLIAQQISQGMSYLHARGIVHKDLKTKNIFFESNKVVITDFGLFCVTKLCRGNR